MKALILLCLLGLALSHTASEWASRTIYQVLTDRMARPDGDTSGCPNLSNYCGGGWAGITNNLGYIQNMGFDAIWVSPVVTNTPNGYHGYWAQNFFTLNSNFGSEQDFINLVSALHARGMWIMLDVVANHAGPTVDTNLDNTNVISPFNQSSYYHPFCNIDWNNQYSIENCWLASLPDLNQTVPYVGNTLLSWISWIVTTYNIDGLRIDTCMEVPTWFWSQFAKASGVYTVCEVDNPSISTNAGYQGIVDGTLNYPLYYLIRDLFQQGQSMYNARSFMQQASSAFSNLNYLGNFVDNHDNPRFLYQYNMINRFQNAIAWSMTWPGIGILYYGDEQAYAGGNDPYNREILWPNLGNTGSQMYTFVTKVVQYRKANQVWNYPWVERYADDNFYCYTRGLAMMAFSNTNNNLQYNVTYHPYQVGQVLCNIFYSTDCVTVLSTGVPVYLNGGETKLYQLQSKETPSEI
ncbi:unnamed protein product [Blepharisma stoltei]|uniref:alpha-amylase n=1 Tax=Blepharisma stoltei TaxID=1481888 RepID=A0AAU9J407_9CILI|nr:unnamed protein product [Blepharisma stoltei]